MSIERNAFRVYIENLIKTKGKGVEETSSYGALQNYINELGKTLEPKVICIINPKNQGAGIPDGGFYTQEQIKNKLSEAERIPVAPKRGVMEVKGVSENIDCLAKSDQVKRYLNKYGQVLITTYREFALIVRGENDQPKVIETFSLAPTEESFWRLCAHPTNAEKEYGDRLSEFLKRALLRNAVLDDPEVLAWFLASYARDALTSIENSDLQALSDVRKGLEEALGIKFEKEQGEHFFRSTLIQTLFYGVFSAWVLWNERGAKSNERFDWRIAIWLLKVPMIRTLFESAASPTKLGPLRLDKILDIVGDTLNRVDRPSFFQKFNKEQAVQYFYEPFLKAFDPDLRKALGVWYTPQEIVEYMVARVDTALREELDISEGLANENVYILDPCCGTGTFLVEVIKRINRSLQEKGGDALLANDLKKAVQERVFGFEILPAPFVIAHLQIGLLLQSFGAPIDQEADERAAIYLTNALTGWEPIKDPKTQFLFPEMQEERDATERIKQNTPILVILGNPPYNAFAGVGAAEEERDLVKPYKNGLKSEWGITKYNLDDLYVRFFRMAERRIAEMTGKGIVCFISNFSFLNDPSFVVMRKHFLEGFDRLWFDCLNGDSRETGKRTPEGKPDPSIFSTERNKEGIRVGTAISLLVKKENRVKKTTVYFRHFWGRNKRAELLESLKTKRFNSSYEKSKPEDFNRYSFRPTKICSDYKKWPSIKELCAMPPYNGLMEKRGGALMDFDRDSLSKRMKAYFNPKLGWAEYKALNYGLTEPRAGGFNPASVREKVISRESFNPQQIVRYSLRPFEAVWCYYSFVNPLWNRCRPQLWNQLWEGNSFLVTRSNRSKDNEGFPFIYSSSLIDAQILGYASAIPIRIKNGKRLNRKDQLNLFGLLGKTPQEEMSVANLSQYARNYLKDLKLPEPDKNPDTAALIWLHSLAIGYSPEYLEENSDGIGQDWPRIPLPLEKKSLLASSNLGSEVAALLDTEMGIIGVSEGEIRKELKPLGIISKVDGKAVQPSDLIISAQWGYYTKDGVVMPGQGTAIERDYTREERKAIEIAAKSLKVSKTDIFNCLGERTFDLYLNEALYWKCVPSRVYEYTIGGYQVIKKLLSYREESVLGRAITNSEARYITEVVRRLAALRLMEPKLDRNYQEIKAKALLE